MANVLDDLGAAVVTEIDVDIRRGDTFRVEESLEEETVMERIEIGDPEHVGDETSRRAATTRADRNALALRVVDEIPDDKKVAGETGLAENAQLEIETLAQGGIVLGALAEAVGQSLEAEAAQVALARLAFGHVVFGKLALAELDLEVAFLGNFQRGGE